MCPPWAAPPATETCLDHLYSSSPSRKGGTIISEEVLDLLEHRLRLADPEKYRPASCRCGCDQLHVHGLRERHPRNFTFQGEPVPVVEILVFACAKCGATWRVLPGFLARCLWRTWDVVEREAFGETSERRQDPVPASTVRRWRARLAQSARVPLQLLAAFNGKLRELADRVGFDASRRQLVTEFAGCFAALAALLHQLGPGIRLM